MTITGTRSSGDIGARTCRWAVILVVFSHINVGAQAIDPADEIHAAQRDERIKRFRVEVSDPESRSETLNGLYALINDEAGAHSKYLRAYAIQALGTESPVEALDFLRRLWDSPVAHPELKYIAHWAWLKVFLAHEPSLPKKEEALGQIVRRSCRWRSSVLTAVEELGDLGAKHKLGDIEQAIQRCLRPFEREQALWLARTKVEILSEEPDRIRALERALVIEDPTNGKRLNIWAVQELRKVGTQEAYDILADKALMIQQQYYTLGADGTLLGPPATVHSTPRFSWDHELYNEIAGILYGRISEEELKRRGLRIATVGRATMH